MIDVVLAPCPCVEQKMEDCEGVKGGTGTWMRAKGHAFESCDRGFRLVVKWKLIEETVSLT